MAMTIFGVNCQIFALHWVLECIKNRNVNAGDKSFLVSVGNAPRRRFFHINCRLRVRRGDADKTSLLSSSAFPFRRSIIGGVFSYIQTECISVGPF